MYPIQISGKKSSRLNKAGLIVTPEGFEPPTNSTGNCHSIQLNYGAIKRKFSLRATKIRRHTQKTPSSAQ